MKSTNRRGFLQQSTGTAGLMVAAPAVVKGWAQGSPSDRVNVAVIGVSGRRERTRGIISGRGMTHIKNYGAMSNVRIATICDVDERLLPGAASEVERLSGQKPRTEVDFRKVLEDPDIDAVSIAVPDHWHALMTIWGCQAGKDVYVEKPVCHNLSEGRKMIQAARKYNRVVQSGIATRANKVIQEGVRFIHEGKLGKVYMAKGIVYSPRVDIGHVPDSAIPEGVHWDLFLGPAPYRPFNLNRYIYTWHWFWDTSTTEFGNNGIYRMDLARWAMQKREHPVKVHCGGGLFHRDSDQEVPNLMAAIYEYADGTIIQNEVRNLYSNPEGAGDRGYCFFYSSEGWMQIGPRGFKTFFGRRNEPGPSLSETDLPTDDRDNTWQNFIDCVRTRRWQDLMCDIQEGHLSTALGHLGVASYRAGRSLNFHSHSERFIDDDEANSYLTRNYRHPYVVPEEV